MFVEFRRLATELLKGTQFGPELTLAVCRFAKVDMSRPKLLILISNDHRHAT
jgi:hypothetical protein